MRTRIKNRRRFGRVRHVFTHFPLELTVFAARARMDAQAPEGCRFLPRDEITDAAFPTLMRKVLAHAGVVAPADDAKRRSSISSLEPEELAGDALARAKQRPVRRPRRTRA